MCSRLRIVKPDRKRKRALNEGTLKCVKIPCPSSLSPILMLVIVNIKAVSSILERQQHQDELTSQLAFVFASVSEYWNYFSLSQRASYLS